MKPGTAIEVSALSFDGSVRWEAATVTRWTRKMGGRASLPPGYEPIRFRDGNVVMIPAARMRLATGGGVQ